MSLPANSQPENPFRNRSVAPTTPDPSQSRALQIHAPTTEFAPPLPDLIRPFVRFGVFACLAFFLIGGGWAATAKLSSAALAVGWVTPDSRRQTVQHLEGGIITEIHVGEGERVRQGQTLLNLADIGAQARFEAVRSKLLFMRAKEIRLEAERANLSAPDFSHADLGDLSDPVVLNAIAAQRAQFNTRRENDGTRRSILQQRIAQLEKQIVGYERQAASKREQARLIAEELTGVRTLFEEGYAPKNRLLELERYQASLKGDEGQMLAAKARAEEAIGEARLQAVNIVTSRNEEIATELAAIQAERTLLQEEITTDRDRLSRTRVVAPTDGVVFNIRFSTIGAVAAPAAELLDIVPVDDRLVIDAQLSPQHVDEVSIGDEAQVIFPTFPQRRLPRISGHVERVSADAMTDARTGDRFYTIQVVVDGDALQEIEDLVDLTPGLPAEVFIQGDERTLLDYLISPLQVAVGRSLREP
ncbi:MAG: HlyD family type I secretion periplasmic adaptor subunit [Pseudomonadota bacterium]